MTKSVRISDRSAARLKELMAREDGQRQSVAGGVNLRQLSWVRVTGAVDGDGYYPCVPTLYDTANATWDELDEALVFGVNDEALADDTRFLAMRAGNESDSTPVFVAIDTSVGGSLTVEEADSSPQYTGITVLRFDQADGFVASNPSAGVARIDLAAATTTQAGIVSTSTQMFGGEKQFLNGVTTTIVSHSGDGTTQDAFTQFDSGTNGLIDQVWLIGDLTTFGTSLLHPSTSTFSISASVSGSLVNAAFVVIDSAAATHIGMYGSTWGGDTVKGGLVISAGTGPWVSAPASASASGTAGQIAYDSSFLYICTATNTWRRIAHATW